MKNEKKLFPKWIYSSWIRFTATNTFGIITYLLLAAFILLAIRQVFFL